MTDDFTIWRTLEAHVPKGTWIPMVEIQAIVRCRVVLDNEDLERGRVLAGPPQWESNLRRLLRTKARAGTIRSRKRSTRGD
jgi:hypothetical protein